MVAERLRPLEFVGSRAAPPARARKRRFRRNNGRLSLGYSALEVRIFAERKATMRQPANVGVRWAEPPHYEPLHPNGGGFDFVGDGTARVFTTASFEATDQFHRHVVVAS